ncbi:HAD-IA family hydrolase [Rhizobium sp. CSW-27]|uniref:HAD-IA family hydrolase n=1 Tax=Rhizobium sp. CSW-27 TaxID=2839985 RepID=UPI001C0177B0|nr:HAD-IA family hydrolase [Rhizobium sp. CSW-27]MBT9369715.1 HAD-IA family hydrolase [Rhizobium sp. CSW-27]
MDRGEYSAEDALSAPRLFVFDVGGVLIRLDHAAHATHLEGSPCPNFREDAALADSIRQFRLGRIASEAYVERLAGIYGVSGETVRQAETALLAGIFADMSAYVQGLRQIGRVVCLSNTQALHWQHILDQCLGPDFFDACYLSHEMGLEKPDPDIYAELARQEGVTGAGIIFIDDTPENVEAAKAIGWADSILHVSGPETMRAIDHILHRAQPAAAACF